MPQRILGRCEALGRSCNQFNGQPWNRRLRHPTQHIITHRIEQLSEITPQWRPRRPIGRVIHDKEQRNIVVGRCQTGSA